MNANRYTLKDLKEIQNSSGKTKVDLGTHRQGGDKKDIYKWTTTGTPGKLHMINKGDLQIHPAYQRDVMVNKVLEISANFSWIGFGALVVAERNGEYWVIDGQHRALAAMRRSDIEKLPCVVFETSDLREEAQGFLDLNAGRKAVSAIGKFKAMVTAGDEIAIYVKQQCELLGLEIVLNASHSGQLKCVAFCLRRAAENKARFNSVLAFGAELSRNDNIPVGERLLEGLWYLNAHCGAGLDDKRLVKRLREKGARKLLDAANRAAAYYSAGGAKVWALGMLAELNKGLSIKFTVDDDTA